MDDIIEIVVTLLFIGLLIGLCIGGVKVIQYAGVITTPTITPEFSYTNESSPSSTTVIDTQQTQLQANLTQDVASSSTQVSNRPQVIHYPAGIRSGIKNVDFILEAFLENDIHSMVNLFQYESENCLSEDWRQGEPLCICDDCESLYIEAFPIFEVNGISFVYSDEIARVFDETTWFPVKGVYAVYRVRQDVPIDSWQAGEYGIVFITADDQSLIVFIEDDHMVLWTRLDDTPRNIVINSRGAIYMPPAETVRFDELPSNLIWSSIYQPGIPRNEWVQTTEKISTYSSPWSVKLEGEIKGTPAIGPDGKICTVSDTGKLYAIDKNGNILWRKSLGERSVFSDFTSPIIAPNERIYIVDDNKLLTFDSDGTPGWHWLGREWLTSLPAFGADGTAYIMTSHSSLWAISSEGKELWRTELCSVYGGGIWPSPVVGPDGIVYAACNSDTVYAVDSINGSVLWSKDPNNKSFDRFESSPVVSKYGISYFSSHLGHIFAFEPDGKLLWSIKLEPPGTVPSSPFALSPDGTLYAVVASTLYAISPDGELLWSLRVTEQIGNLSARSVAGDGSIYIKGSGKELLHISSNGTIISAERITKSSDEEISSPVLGFGERLYVGIGNKLHSRDSLAEPTKVISPTATATLVTATPTITPVPSMVPQPATTVTPRANTYKITKFTKSVRVGSQAFVVIETQPRASCFLNYRTPAGTFSTAAGLGAKTANDKGRCSWKWRIGTSTRPGTGFVYISVDGTGGWYPIQIK